MEFIVVKNANIKIILNKSERFVPNAGKFIMSAQHGLPRERFVAKTVKMILCVIMSLGFAENVVKSMNCQEVTLTEVGGIFVPLNAI